MRAVCARPVEGRGVRSSIQNERAECQVEAGFLRAVRVFPIVNGHRLEQTVALQVGYRRLVIPDHRPRQPRQLSSTVLLRVEEIGTHQLHQTEEPEVLPAVRRARKEQERVDLPSLFEVGDQAVCECLAGPLIEAQMMRLVDDHQIPRLGGEEPLARAPLIAAQSVNGCHDLRRCAPEIPAPRIRLGDVALQPDVKHVLEAKLPLRHQLRRR